MEQMDVLSFFMQGLWIFGCSLILFYFLLNKFLPWAFKALKMRVFVFNVHYEFFMKTHFVKKLVLCYMEMLLHEYNKFYDFVSDFLKTFMGIYSLSRLSIFSVINTYFLKKMSLSRVLTIHMFNKKSDKRKYGYKVK